MKCPRCWAEKAYVRIVHGWKGVLLKCLLIRPMKCHHCYHKFAVPWVLTIGRRLTPPPLRIAPHTRQSGPSYAARRQTDALDAARGRPPIEPRRRADAA